MKSLSLAILALLVSTTAFAEQAKPAKKPAVGDTYDLPRRGHKTSVPRADATTQKISTVTEAMVAKIAKVRRGEVEYCWERLPASQRTKSTAVLHLEIEASGEVAAVEVGGDAPSEAASCIADLAHRWTFPAVDAKSVVDYTIRLR
jgi:hypothetical protein